MKQIVMCEERILNKQEDMFIFRQIPVKQTYPGN
jgi:hypothetical protein